jgi:uncharacterized membrane protein
MQEGNSERLVAIVGLLGFILYCLFVTHHPWLSIAGFIVGGCLGALSYWARSQSSSQENWIIKLTKFGPLIGLVLLICVIVSTVAGQLGLGIIAGSAVCLSFLSSLVPHLAKRTKGHYQ